MNEEAPLQENDIINLNAADDDDDDDDDDADADDDDDDMDADDADDDDDDDMDAANSPVVDEYKSTSDESSNITDYESSDEDKKEVLDEDDELMESGSGDSDDQWENVDNSNEGDDDDDDALDASDDDSCVTFYGHTAPIICCSLHPKRPFAATSDTKKCTYIWHTETGEKLFKIPHKCYVTHMSFNFNGHYLALVKKGSYLLVYKINKKSANIEMFTRVLYYPTDGIKWIAWFQYESVLVGGGNLGVIYKWRMPYGMCRKMLGHRSSCIFGVLTKDDEKLYVAFQELCLQLWDITTRNMLMQVDKDDQLMHKNCITAIDCKNDGSLYVSADVDGELLLCTDNGPLKTIKPGCSYSHLSFTPSAKLSLIAMGSAVNSICTWNYENGQIYAVTRENNPFSNLIWISDNVIAITTSMGLINGIDVLTSQCKFTLSGHTGAINTFDYNRHTHIALTAGDDKRAKIFQFP